LAAIEALAVWCSLGTEIAHPLFSQKKTVGVEKTPAKFSASWKSPSLVAPSPRQQSTAASSAA
jgi:hypothetical protein